MCFEKSTVRVTSGEPQGEGEIEPFRSTAKPTNKTFSATSLGILSTMLASASGLQYVLEK
jgi:hypothetical protein